VTALRAAGTRPSAPAIPGGAPWPSAGRRERELVEQVLAGGVWGGTMGGPMAVALGAALADLHGAAHGVAVSSGTARDIGPGDEVVVPAYTFAATALAVAYTGAIVVFADIDPATLCLDPASAEAARSERTRAVIPVHFGGTPADMRTLAPWAARHKLAIVEDCAHAHGGALGGKGLGTWGEAGCFSFQQNKNVTGGEGGAIITDDAALADACRHTLSRFGRVAGGPPHHHVRLGFNYALAELPAAVAVAGLERLPAENAIRDRARRRLVDAMGGIDGVTAIAPADESDVVHACHLLAFRVDPVRTGLSAADVAAGLTRSGVACRTLYPVPLYQQPVFEPGGHVNGGLGSWRAVATPHAIRACHEIAYLPQWALLAGEECAERCVDALTAVIEHAGEGRSS
jgi:dTDP-4-amino-4,6-dideoxygalactose transaminase